MEGAGILGKAAAGRRGWRSGVMRRRRRGPELPIYDTTLTQPTGCLDTNPNPNPNPNPTQPRARVPVPSAGFSWRWALRCLALEWGDWALPLDPPLAAHRPPASKSSFSSCSTTRISSLRRLWLLDITDTLRGEWGEGEGCCQEGRGRGEPSADLDDNPTHALTPPLVTHST